MNKLLALALIIGLALTGYAAGAKAQKLDELQPIVETTQSVKIDTYLPPKRDPKNPDAVIQITITGSRQNGHMLYVEYTATRDGAEIKGSIDAPLESSGADIEKLILCDILREPPQSAVGDAAKFTGMTSSLTESEAWEKLYPTPEPTKPEDITPLKEP